MQIVLIIITGFAIALSPIVNKEIDKVTNYIKAHGQVYYFVVLIGGSLSFISFGWIVITCVLARELALRIKVNQPMKLKPILSLTVVISLVNLSFRKIYRHSEACFPDFDDDLFIWTKTFHML